MLRLARRFLCFDFLYFCFMRQDKRLDLGRQFAGCGVNAPSVVECVCLGFLAGFFNITLDRAQAENMRPGLLVLLVVAVIK